MKKILILNGHPISDCFCDAVAEAYSKGAEEGKHDVQFVNIRDLEFDLVLKDPREKESLEADIKKQQEMISWCDHLVVITPVWWMSCPALLKGYFDRVLLSGFAFKYQKDLFGFIPQWEKLLKGRSARVIYTQVGKQWTLRLFAGDSFWKTISTGTLWFCGFNPVKRTLLSQTPGQSEKAKNRREKFLKKVFELGKRGQ